MYFTPASLTGAYSTTSMAPTDNRTSARSTFWQGRTGIRLVLSRSPLMRSLDDLPAARWTTAALALLWCTATWGTVAAQNAQLKLVSTAWPPFTNAPKQARFALDLVEAALG